MFQSLKKIVKSIKRIAQKKLNFIVFFVTSSCNSRCRSCFFWKELDKKNDLTLEEIEKISKNLDQFDALLLSGGEPFLRQDLPQLVDIFVKNNNIKSLGIPTNSLLNDKIVSDVKAISNNNPNLNLDINLSLDGLEADHDYIRGVPGSFNRVISLIPRLGELKKVNKNLKIIVNSIICRRNYNNLVFLADYIHNNFSDSIDMHVFEIIRGDAKDATEKNLNKEEVRLIFNKLFGFQVKNYLGNKSFKERLLAIGSLATKYNLQYKAYSNRRWGIKCHAGETTAVIYPDGNLAYCELKDSLVDLKNEDFKISNALKSNLVKIQRKIEKEKCDCTHICFVNEAIWNSFFAVFCLLPFYYFKWLVFKKAI